MTVSYKETRIRTSFYHEDVGSMDIRNVGILQHHYMA